MAEHVLSGGSLLRVPFEHWEEEITQHSSLIFLHLVLLHEHLFHWPMLQTSDFLEMARDVEVSLRVLST